MAKKILLFIVEAVVMGALFCLVMWIVDLIFKPAETYTPAQWLIRGATFGILFTLFSTWSRWTKRKRKQ